MIIIRHIQKRMGDKSKLFCIFPNRKQPLSSPLNESTH